MIKNILHYRYKQGKFRHPEDFRKIYGLTEEQYQTLRPYIQITKGEGLFWVTPVDKAVKQIKKAISKKKKVAFISKRWRYVTILFRLLPSAIYCRI